MAHDVVREPAEAVRDPVPRLRGALRAAAFPHGGLREVLPWPGRPRRTRRPHHTRFARHGSLRIAYELRGRFGWCRPWLVLIQGVGFDRAAWQPVLHRLGRRFRLVLVDNRGSGGSDLPWAPFRVADMAADVVAVLDDAGIRRAHVMGMSLGGMVAQELAVGYPDRVDGLVLVSTSPGWPFAYPVPAASTVLLAASRAMPPGEAAGRRTGNAWPPDSAAREPELVRHLISLQRSRPTGLRAWMAQAAAGASYAGQRRQTRIRARTLVLHGTADTVVDPRNGRLLARRIPGARLVTFPGLGHVLCWQDPAGFAAVVSAFLRR